MATDTPVELLDALNAIRWRNQPIPESLDEQEGRHVSRVRAVFRDKNVVGLGIAKKVTGGRETDDLALCFYVRKKLRAKEFDATFLIPTLVSVANRTAVFTDVQEIGNILPQVNSQQSPLLSGFSIGTHQETGTLSAIVRKQGRLHLLSNSHVIAANGLAAIGDDVVYPGIVDAKGEIHKVGTLAQFVPFIGGADFVNKVDAAIAELDPGFGGKLDFDILGASLPLSTTAPVRGMQIMARGRTSGEVTGVIDDINFSFVTQYRDIGEVGFVDQVKCSNYSRPGDSGALIVERQTGSIVGLHFAGSTDASIFNPISEVLLSLQIAFVDGALT